jgi:hypothetical protein
MAEFKLGRIRFVWKGVWTPQETYLVDDVITSGGKSYICVVNHTSAVLFETDISSIPTKWEIVSDGVRWRGDWQPSTYYNPGGLVKFGGIVYLCKESHTSATFVSPTFLGLEEDLDKWDIFATSFNWIGEWTNSQRYKINDIVTYGGATYICNSPHISASASLNLAVTGASGDGETVTLTFATQVVEPYAVGSSITVANIVPAEYNGTYTVTSSTTSAVSFTSEEEGDYESGGTILGVSQLGLEKDQDKWDTFNQGVTYLGTWTNAGGVRYKEQDLVSYGANLWICVTPHSSTANWLDDQTNWEIFLKGFEFESSWNVSTEYQIGDTVIYGGYSFIASTNHVGSVPTESPLDWEAYVTGFNFRGDYLVSSEYRVGDVIRYGGTTYLAMADSQGEGPIDNTDFWQRLNYGVRWTNNSQTYEEVSGTNVIGTGTGAEFTVLRNNTVYTVTITDGGSGYAINNTIKVLGSAVGGISPANDLLITVTEVASGVITEVTWGGTSTSWQSGIVYLPGDVALYGATSFICVEQHTSDSSNRPDADTTGEFWNALSIGAESAILTTDGDMLYYGENGPTRLPIGSDGQLLRVKDGYPTWAYYGIINNVVYVAPEGVDTLDAGQGLTIDKPWRTVRYATESIEAGYLNPTAKELLYKNKQFLMKEVSNWVTYTYTVTVTSADAASDTFTCNSTANLVANMPIKFSGTVFGGINTTTTYYIRQITSSTQFSVSTSAGGAVVQLSDATGTMTARLDYNYDKCERDTGILVDAVIYDLTHGGNEDTTIAAQSYYTPLGLSYITANLGSQVSQTIAAYNYLKSLVSVVLANDSPEELYQTLNSQPTVALQYANPAVNVDDSVITDAQALLDIVINGLASGSAASIKSSIKGQTTVSVKTGTYFEILPIVVPKNTAIVGDELRSTVVSPNAPIALLANDKPKSISSLTRLKDIISNVIQNTPVTPTAGNNQLQVTSLPAGNVGSTVAVNRAVASAEVMYDVLNNGLGSEPVLILPNPVGYDTGFLNARTQIVQNNAFITADVSQFLVNNYTALWSSLGDAGRAACQRDIGYILDAIRYDLTYGGNTQSLIAGRAYYSYLDLVIASTEVTATLAAYGHLRTIIGQVAQKLAVTPQAGNTTPQVTAGTGGSTTAATFAQARVQNVIDWINNGTSPALIEPSTAWVNATIVAAKDHLLARKSEIQTDAIGWVKKFYQNLNFNQDTCSRDVGYIVDAFSYDILFGSNFASIIAARSYYRAIDSAQVVITSQKAASIGLINFLKYKVKSIVTGGAGAQAITSIDDMIGNIKGGAVPRFTWPDYSTLSSARRVARTLIWDNKKFAEAEVIAYITANYPSLDYDAEVCARDVGYLIDALRYDLTYGGNSQTLAAAEAYYSYGVTFQIPAGQKAATLAAFTFLGDLLYDISLNLNVTELQVTVPQIIGDAGSDITTAQIVEALVNAFITTVDNISNKPAVVQPSTSWVSAGLLTQQANLFAVVDTVKTEVTEYIGINYPNLSYDVATCERDVGIIVNAIAWDLALGSNYRSVKSGMSYYRNVASLVVGPQKTATLQAYRFLKGLLKDTVILNDEAVASVKRNMDIIINIIDKGIGETPEINGTNTYKNDLQSFNATQVLEANKDFLASELAAWTRVNFGGTVQSTTAATSILTTGTDHNLSPGDPVIFAGLEFGNVETAVVYYVLETPSSTTFKISTSATSTTPVTLINGTGSMTVTYFFNEELCKRDTRSYIDAIIYDIHYPGNYKSLTASTLYNNAVGGSVTENMYLTRNGCGIRNQTVVGLTGVLSEENDFGTRRPTAGAYVSLDPGFGPADYKVWVTTKSCYVQNVTTFGSGCVGNKIDGALHLGGNKSMVSNDFTQVLSDGIGVWCTGSGSLTELVSVFSYYGYAGYLAELGGRIRATNGNSSYGTYGVIAEGTDTFEQPIFATVNNRFFDAEIALTVTDSTDEILRLEYGNAGRGYTNAVYTISGAGFNASAFGDEFRDGAVFETRIVDLDDGNGVGGTSYVTAANAAQSGEVGKVTIANTDTALSGAYLGMRIQLTAGTGVGQFANILTYNNGTKEAVIFKESFTPLTVTNTTVTSNVLTVASTANLYLNMPVVFGNTSFGGVTANEIYYVRTIPNATTFTISLEVAGATVTLSTASGSMPLYAAGWDHVVPGRTVFNALDLTTAYIIEPRIQLSAPGYTATARTVTNAQWADIIYGDNRFVAVANGSTNSIFSADGNSWGNGGALVDSTQRSVTFGGGEGARAYAVIGGLGGQGAVLQAVLGTPNTTGAATQEQIASVRIIDGGQGYTTPPVIEFTPVSGGTGARATCTVLNGKIDSVLITIPGSGYTVAPTVNVRTDRVTDIIVENWGKNYASGTTTVTLLGGGFSTQAQATATVSVNGGITDIRLRDSNDVFEGGIGYLGFSGIGYTSAPSVIITDTNAKYISISGSSNTTCFQTPTGLGSAWTAGGNLPSTTFAAVAYGVVSGSPIFVAVGGASSAARTSNGTAWTGSVIPVLGAGTYSDLAFGNSTFVAISTGNNATATSSNGTTWTIGGNLPSSTTWTSVAYGNGRFVAIASGGRSTAYSIDKGANWTASLFGLPSSQTWTKVAYGQGLFMAIASGTSVCATSPDGVLWTVRAMPSSTTWNAIAFGNPANKTTFVAAAQTTAAALIRTGATAQARMRVASGVVTEVRMIEPGSGYPTSGVSATSASTDAVTTTDTTNLVNSQPVQFTGLTDVGLEENITYYVIGSTIVANTSFKVSAVAGSTTPVDLVTATGLSGTYRAGPILTQTDPNRVKTAALEVRLGDGALGNPTFTNRGAENTTATAVVSGDGRADLYQPGNFINVAGLYEIPLPGANVVFGSIPNRYYKLVAVTNVLGIPGNYTAQFQVNPDVSVLEAPPHNSSVTTTLLYSQVRLTGHDFLYIGTGNFSRTNYPNVDISTAIQADQTAFTGGGRVFFTSTDQDGNFNVGNLFGVQQATGTATLNASAFNLSGLQSLQLGSVAIGIGSAVITQFSTDPFFTADSDSIVPTQRAIRAYITSQIGGGASSLNVNTLTSGVVFIAGNSITTTTGVQINVNAKLNFTGGIDGAPVALAFFNQR